MPWMSPSQTGEARCQSRERLVGALLQLDHRVAQQILNRNETTGVLFFAELKDRLRDLVESFLGDQPTVQGSSCRCPPRPQSSDAVGIVP